MTNEGIETPRLFLRRWCEQDRAPFAAMNADARVMEFLPRIMSREESDAFAARISKHFDEHGFGFWAVEARGISDFVGFIGLAVPGFEAHFTPAVEIGWRLAHAYWGRGYATEAAKAALDFGFEQLKLGEIVSYTVPDNLRSRRVMEGIGMKYSPAEDFDHPKLPEEHRLRRHVLYRIGNSGFSTPATQG